MHDTEDDVIDSDVYLVMNEFSSQLLLLTVIIITDNEFGNIVCENPNSWMRHYFYKLMRRLEIAQEVLFA